MSLNPLHGHPVEFAHLLAHQVLPPATCTTFKTPRRARVTARTYGGDTVTIVADVVARSREWLCVAQEDNGSTWNVWVHKACCEPV